MPTVVTEVGETSTRPDWRGTKIENVPGFSENESKKA
jgi:hypothetical protein